MKNVYKYICAVVLLLGMSVSAWGVTYQKVTDLSQLSTGDVVIITNNMPSTGSGYALGKTKNNSVKYERVAVTSSGGKISYSGSDILELTVKINTSNTPYLYAFWDGSGFLYDTGTNNEIATNSEAYSKGLPSGANWVWTLSINGSGNTNTCINIKNGKTSTRALQYYTSGSTGYYASHTWTTISNSCIWKIACEEPTLTLSPTSKTMTFGDDGNTFTITKTTNSGGTITWTSSNTSVATVAKNGSNNGVVTVVGAGTSTIKCKVGEYESGGTTYCEKEVSFSLTVNPACPTLAKGTDAKALTAGSITSTSATLSGGIVTYKGGANLTAYGFVYGTSANPTTSNSTANVGVNIAENTAFGSKNITGLTPNTTYYVRVYGTNGCGTRYSPDGPSGYITFTTLQRYTISYNNNGGGGSISSQYKDHGATATLNSGSSFSKTGYTLKEWNTAADGNGDTYALSGSYTANADVTMYAVWTPNPYTITLDNQTPTTASTPTSINATFNASTNLTGTVVTTLPTKTGYTFNGYYTGKNGAGTQIITAAGVVNASANDGGSNTYTDASKNWKYPNDLTVYAYWTANTISLTLNKNGGDADGSATVKYDATTLTSVSHATRSEWNLVGYYAEAGCTHKVLTNTGALVNYTGYVEDGKWVRTTTPTTLYAKWSKVQYTVTFNMNGHGDAIEAQDVESGDPAIRPTPDPSEEDWRFLGWFDASSGGSEWNFSTGITGNTTIYAHWEAISYNTGTYKAWCEPNITLSGDVYLTSAKDVAVYSTNLTDNLIRIQSTDLAGVDKLDIKYLDADNADAVVEHASSLFRLCNNGTENYNVADGTQIDVSGSNTYDQTFSIRYTPNVHNVINHYKLQITMKHGTRAVKTVTRDLYGRSLPEEFVIAIKYTGDSKWYALPNTMGTSATTVTPIRITVDNTTTPTIAKYAPTTTVYKAMDRYKPDGNDQWTSIRFTPDGSKHLQASSTTSTYKLWLPTGNAKLQNWYLQSNNGSALNAYTVKSDAANTIANKQLACYASGGVKMGFYDMTKTPKGAVVYFLPIETKLIDLEASVTEWGQKSVILDVDAQAATSARARVDDGANETAATFEQTRTSVKGAASKYNYTLTFSTLDFSASKKGKLLYIDWLDAEDAVISTSAIPIPWIIASSGVMKSIASSGWGTEVHVLPGVTLEANAGDFTSNKVTISKLEIYPGATVTVTKGSKASGTLTATTLILRNGWSRAGSKRYDVARLYVNPDNATLKATNVYSDWYIDYDQYYPVAVPWNVTTSGMTYLNTNNAASGGVKMRYYDGAGRAAGSRDASLGENWLAYSVDGKAYPATLTPGMGYAMTAKRPTGKAFSIVRMPLSLPSGTWASGAWTTNGEQGEVSDVHKDQVTVTAHGDANTPAFSKGWNFIGNPYMALYQGELSGDDAAIEYATIPDLAFEEFDQLPISTTKLKPSSGFFVQAGNSGTITFGTANRKASAPSYMRKETDPVVQKAYIQLADESSSDLMGLLIGEQYTADYDDNADLVKMLGSSNSLKTYMYYSDMNMAYLALNETLAKEWIPVIVRVPNAGAYTFSLQDISVTDNLEGVYLIDYGNSDEITNLINNNYTFYAPAGTISGRFAINAKVGERTPTDVDVVNAEEKDSSAPIKFIYHEKIYIMYNGVIYDMTGKRVQEINK